ncbi:hypothetical protein [Paraburkholderia sp. HD33-4]|uniref:hypothetical protein n=1 Tax=Paraburkholderia sp. HD33-4 TaxID=2883242 RepID=UPI001F3ED925|nr:hypothetical protein [Paraburkholderia sp. HD33-4]
MSSRRSNPSRPALGRTRATRAALVCAAAFALAACAQPWEQFHAGDQESAVVARLGQPREIYDLPDGSRRLMWPTQPMGEITTAADVDSTGKVIRVRQVLQQNEFYRAEPGKWTKNDVLVNFGQPVDKTYFPMMKREVWSYRYLEDNVWYLMFNFYFDDTGVLRSTQKSPDPLHLQGGDNKPM